MKFSLSSVKNACRGDGPSEQEEAVAQAEAAADVAGPCESGYHDPWG